MYLASWPVIRCFVLSSYVITIIVHLRLPESYGEELKKPAVYTLNQLLSNVEKQKLMKTGKLPERFIKSKHPGYLQIGLERPVIEKRRQRRKPRVGYYTVPRWKYIAGKIVPNYRYGKLRQLINRKGSNPNSANYGQGGPGGRNEDDQGGPGDRNEDDQGGPGDGNEDNQGDDGGKKGDGKGEDGNANDDVKVLDGGGKMKRFNDLAKKALDKVPKLNGKGGEDDGNAEGDGNVPDNGGGKLNQLKEKAKNAYGKLPGAKSVGAMLDKGKNNGLGHLKKLNGMANNAYDKIPSVGKMFGKSADGPGIGEKGKEAIATVNDLVKNNEVTKAVGNYLMGLIPGGEAAEKAIAAKEKLGKAVKKIPKFGKKKKAE